jgi:hypothetical protein
MTKLDINALEFLQQEVDTRMKEIAGRRGIV